MTEELKQLREALRRVKYEAASLADAQVIALESITAAQPAQAADDGDVTGQPGPLPETGWDEVPEGAFRKPSPTAGMNLGQRIKHVGGRENAAGYIEFGSVAAVRALVRQYLRDLPTQPAAQATPEPSHGMIGMGAHALANELAQAVAQDDADPDGHDMSAGLFGPNVSAWLRKISAEYLSQPATPEPVLSIELIRLADIIRDCGRLVSKSGNAERIMRDAARVLATPEPVPNKRECPHCNYTGSAHCGDVADKLKASGGDPKDCSNAKVYGLRADAQVIALTALLNDPAVIEAAQPGDIGRAFMATREDL